MTIPKRKIIRKKREPRAYEYGNSDEWRMMVDDYLQGRGFGWIGKKLGRELTAVEVIVRNIIPRNDTQNGLREPPLERLRRSQSCLDPNRKLTRHDRSYFFLLRSYQVSLQDCCWIMHVKEARLKALQEAAGKEATLF